MTLEDIVKMITGGGFSFAFGYMWGYNLAQYDEDLSNKPQKTQTTRDRLNGSVISALGGWLQISFGHSDPFMGLMAGITGVIGAYAGNIVGGRLWHRDDNFRAEADQTRHTRGHYHSSSCRGYNNPDPTMKARQLLEVGINATSAELKRAYHRKARQYHPDLHPDDPRAEIMFKDVNEAYQMLTKNNYPPGDN